MCFVVLLDVIIGRLCQARN